MKTYSLFVFLLVCAVFPNLNTFASDDKFVYNSHNKRDPFIAPGGVFGQKKDDKRERAPGPIVKGGGIKLEGVVYDPHGGSRVIINGCIMKAGDKTDLFEIKQIDRDGVILDVLGERKIVKLKRTEGSKVGRGQ